MSTRRLWMWCIHYPFQWLFIECPSSVECHSIGTRQRMMGIRHLMNPQWDWWCNYTHWLYAWHLPLRFLNPCSLPRMCVIELCLYLPHGCTGIDEGLSITRKSSVSAIILMSSAVTGCSCLKNTYITLKNTALMYRCVADPQEEFSLLSTHEAL